MLDDPDAEFPMVSGVAWYRREQWALLKSTASDADDLEETYDEWLEFAKHSFKVIWDTGIDLVKVDVDVDELIEWCRNEERPVDGAARTSFVIQKMKEQDLGTGQQPPERRRFEHKRTNGKRAHRTKKAAAEIIEKHAEESCQKKTGKYYL